MKSKEAIEQARRRLIGRWRSDRDRTISNWVFPKAIARAKYKKFGEIFGDFEWRVTQSQVFFTSHGQTSRRSYQILWADEWSAIIHFLPTKTEEDRCRQIFFDSSPDYFYFVAGRAGNCEYFRRVTQ